MFLSHTENAHKDRQEKHQPHVSTKPNQVHQLRNLVTKEKLSSSERTTLLRCVVIS